MSTELRRAFDVLCRRGGDYEFHQAISTIELHIANLVGKARGLEVELDLRQLNKALDQNERGAAEALKWLKGTVEKACKGIEDSYKQEGRLFKGSYIMPLAESEVEQLARQLGIDWRSPSKTMFINDTRKRFGL